MTLDLYLITPEAPREAIAALCERALRGVTPGLRVGVQLRAGHLPAAERRELALQLREATLRARTLLLVNADLELARAVGADGVQLPERGPDPRLARALLGDDALLIASRHDLAGIEAATAAGADAATLSPVFAVAGKGAALGADGFARVAARAEIPLLALGGLGVEHVAAMRGAGACGVAMIRTVFGASDPAAEVARLCAALAASRRGP